MIQTRNTTPPKVKNIPQLRFPGFEGEWVEDKLENKATFTKGKGISKSDIVPDGEFNCIRYGELYTHYSEVISDIYSKTSLDSKQLVFSEENDVIIPASGETQIDIATASCVLKEGVALSGDLNIIKSSLNGVFLSYYLNNAKRRDIARLSQGISVVHLYSRQLKSLKLNFPQLPEQQKIASFLTTVDKRIALLTQKKEKLEEYKKGVMQRVFNQELGVRNDELKNKQSLRFKDDNGQAYPDWEEKKLGEVLQYIQPTKYIVKNTEYNLEYNTPVLTAGKTFILGYTDEKEGVFSENLPVIIFDDFTTSNKFVNFSFKVKSSALKILIPKENVDIKYVFEAIQMIKYEIGGHERHWISKYSNLIIKLPSLPEQQKIANFLSSLDKEINNYDTRIEKMKEWKKGLLQQLFV